MGPKIFRRIFFSTTPSAEPLYEFMYAVYIYERLETNVSDIEKKKKNKQKSFNMPTYFDTNQILLQMHTHMFVCFIYEQ